jgi:hypothetical protein
MATLYGRLPFAKVGLGVLGRIGCSSISGLLVQAGCLLALMESADLRLILLEDSKSQVPDRLGGSGSDLTAITLYRPCATFPAATPCQSG